MARAVGSAVLLPAVLLCAAGVGCGPADPSLPTSCVSDRECRGAACVRDVTLDADDESPLPLTCDHLADAGVDADLCRAASDCARGVCLVSGACVIPCGEAQDCAVGERCEVAYARGEQGALHPVAACIGPTVLPGGVQRAEQWLSDAIDALPADNRLDFEAPEVTTLHVLEHRSTTPWPRTVQCRTPLCITELRTRGTDPVVLFDAAALTPGGQPPLNTVGTSVDAFVATVLLPNGPSAVLSDEGYTVTFVAEAGGDLGVTRLSRATRGTVLDLHLHYVGAGGLRPEGDRGPPLIMTALQHAAVILEQAGLVLGQVTQTEVTGALSGRLSTIEKEFGVLAELPELLSLSAGARTAAVHVFLVDQVDVALGVSGGTPGPMAVQGTGSSGVAMSVLLFDDGAQLGRALAHELGHYLGLFHPVERDGVRLDPLPATPTDGSNLMGATASGGTSLTDAQRDVLARAVLLR